MGVAQSSEFKINTYTTSVQQIPSVALDSDGDFVVTWQSYVQDGSYQGVYAKRYQVNTCPVVLNNPIPIGITNESCDIRITGNTQSGQSYEISSNISITLLPNTTLVSGSNVRLFINP
nr:hypothetical protein [Desulfobacula sp.]